MQETIAPVILTRREAAARARVGLNTLDEWINRREFPVRRAGRRVLIPARTFEAFLTCDDTAGSEPTAR